MHVMIRSILLKKNANNQTPPVLPPPFPVTPLGFVRLSHFCAEELKMSCSDILGYFQERQKTTIVSKCIKCLSRPKEKMAVHGSGPSADVASEFGVLVIDGGEVRGL